MAEKLGMDPREVESMPADLFDEGVAWINVVRPEIEDKATKSAKNKKGTKRR